MAPDHLYLTASIVAATSATGFKVSVLRGQLRFRLSRHYTARSIDVYMEGFKSVRLVQRQSVNMNVSADFQELNEQLCCIQWDLGTDLPINANREYCFDFSALLDARLPRSIRAGQSSIYYRLTADIPNLRSLKTETRLVVPWSRSAVMAQEELDYDVKPVSIPLDGHDAHGESTGVVLEVPDRAIKGPDRSMHVYLRTHTPPAKLALTAVDVEIVQLVKVFLERLPSPHEEDPYVVQRVKADWRDAIERDGTWSLEVAVPLPAEIHAEMVQNNHLHCHHELAITLHRSGLLKRAKHHRQKIILHHLDIDAWLGKQLPDYAAVMTRDNADPEYNYVGRDRKHEDAYDLRL